MNLYNNLYYFVIYVKYLLNKILYLLINITNYNSGYAKLIDIPQFQRNLSNEPKI